MKFLFAEAFIISLFERGVVFKLCSVVWFAMHNCELSTIQSVASS